MPRGRAAPSLIARLLAAAGALPGCSDGADDVFFGDPTPVLTNPELPDAYVGHRYRHTLHAAQAQGLDVQVARHDGRSPPPGLQLIPDPPNRAVLTGIPTEAGRFSFSVRLTSSGAPGIVRELSLTVSTKPEPLELLTRSLPEGVAGQPYDAAIRSSGAVAEWALASGELPPGLRLEPRGRDLRVGGTPTSPGRYRFAITAVAPSGPHVTGHFVIDIEEDDGWIGIVPAAPTPARVGVPYRFPIHVGWAQTNLRWEILDPGPPGIEVEPTGNPSALVGIPTAEGHYSFRVQVRSARGVDRRALYLEVLPPPSPLQLAEPMLAHGYVGEPYRATLSTSGGAGERVVWQLRQGILPPGIAFGPTDDGASATLSGTPTRSGRFEFEIEANDELSLPVSAWVELEIRGPRLPLTVTASRAVSGVIPLPAGRVGAPYQASVEARGGEPLPPGAPPDVPRHTWSVTGGALPPGIALATTGPVGTGRGVLGGIPHRTGVYTATVTVFDRGNARADQRVQIRVLAP